MAKFSMYLPPFAPDYSGVCSALFDLNSLTVIHDAAGCTGNYTGFDEPRWYGSRKAVFCSGLREIDAIMGNEDKFIRRISDAAKEHNPDFIAFVGSPVPMVIGTDFEGFAKELEFVTGIPSFGFATNGLGYYTDGEEMAGRALLDRFAADAPAKKPRTVNILGATPLDISEMNLAALREFLAENHWEVNACLFMGLTMSQLRSVGLAEVNLAVSGAAIRLGRYLRERYDTPCVTGLPCGAANARDFLKLLERSASAGEDAVHASEIGESPNTLVVGEEVFANSVRNALWRDRGVSADVGGLFGTGVYSHTLNLADERRVIAAVNDPRYRTVIADPLICELISEPAKAAPLAHYAVSSKTGTQFDKPWIAEAFNLLQLC
jgi:hypothetical protein